MRLVAIAALILSLHACGPPQDPAPSPSSTRREGDGTRIRLVDRARDAGIDFVHDSGGTGKRYMPEMTGAGGALFDMDGDGDLDLLCINGGPLPGDLAPKANALFENDGRGHFTRVEDAGGLAGGSDYGTGCAVADVDGDGDLDVAITNWGVDRLHLNDGRGRFVRVEGEVFGGAAWSASCAFGDLDGDGLPELWITRYLDYDIAEHEACFTRDVPIFCGPQPYSGVCDGLYANLGGGSFRDVTDERVTPRPDGKGLGVVMVDHDRDGDLDVYVANDQTPNFLFENDGNGGLDDIGGLAGVHVSRDGEAEAGMGVAIADYDNDGREDIVVTNYQDQVNSVYHNEDDGFFMEASWETGVGYPTRCVLGWGVGLVDLDNDGWKDLYFGNGHVDDTAGRLSDYAHWKQADLVLRNVEGRFVEEAVEGIAVPSVTRGVAFGDVDADGDVDVVCFDLDGPTRLLFNESDAGAWIMVAALNEAGAPAIGARVVARAGGLSMTGAVQAGSSYLSCCDSRIHFGLGEADVVDEVEIHWPGGEVSRCGPIAAGRLLVATHGGKTWTRDPRSGARLEEIETR